MFRCDGSLAVPGRGRWSAPYVAGRVLPRSYGSAGPAALSRPDKTGLGTKHSSGVMSERLVPVLGRGGRKIVRQGGIILMEVLAAAAILAVAALALIAVRERCIQREGASARLLAATRIAEQLVAEVAAEATIVPATEEGEAKGLPGCLYRREVELKSDAESAQLFRIHVAVSYNVSGREQTLDLEKWVYRRRGDAASQ